MAAVGARKGAQWVSGANAARLGVTTIRQGQVQESSECSEALGGYCWAGQGRGGHVRVYK